MNEPDNTTLTRRAFVLGAGGLGVFGVLASRLYYLQVVQAESYIALSEDNRFNYNLLVPSRGRILDRNGIELAVNEQNYRVVIIPEQVKDIDYTLSQLSEKLDLTEKSLARIKDDIRTNPKFVPILIAEHLDWNVFAQVNLNTPDLPGVVPQVGQGRAYPHQGTFSHVLGYVGRAGPEDVERNPDPLLRHPTFRIGKTGVEAAVDETLRGKSGRLKVEVNAVGRIIREWPDPANIAVSGNDVWLTLDSELQSYAAELYEEDSGGVALIDVMTGELRTLLSMPTFDGNLFVSGLTQADMDRMNSDEQRPQFNKVMGGGYPPASTFKMAVMLAGLKHRVIDPDETIYCTGRVQVGNRAFHCWKRQGHGPMNLRDSLKHSCDIYYYEIAHRLEMERVHDMAISLGLGQRYELGVDGQTKGIVPYDKWKREQLGSAWRMGDSLNAVIGQGFVLATPLQLAVMTARIANGQKAVAPSLIIGKGLPEFSALDINVEHLSLVKDAMLSVCEEIGGTAYRPYGLGLGEVQMAGKTGTGQVRGISASERASGVLKNNVLPWRLRDHSIFVGFAPYDAPRFAVGVVVEHGGSGAKRAAHIARSLLSRALERDGIVKQRTELDTGAAPL